MLTGIDIFNKWILDNNHIYKFAKDTEYHHILSFMLPTISSKERVLVLKSFKEKKIISDKSFSELKKIKKPLKKDYNYPSTNHRVFTEEIRRKRIHEEIIRKRIQEEKDSKDLLKELLKMGEQRKKQKEIERRKLENELKLSKNFNEIELNEKYKFVLDLSAREIEYFVEDKCYQAIRLFLLMTFTRKINELISVHYLERKCPKLKRIGIRKIMVFLDCIKDHPRIFELLQSLRPAFKYICNIEDEVKAIIAYVN